MKRRWPILGAVMSFGACVYFLEAAVLQDWLSGFPDAEVGNLTNRAVAFLSASGLFFFLGVWLAVRAYRWRSSAPDGTGRETIDKN